jgi:hypothetical protein
MPIQHGTAAAVRHFASSKTAKLKLSQISQGQKRQNKSWPKFHVLQHS